MVKKRNNIYNYAMLFPGIALYAVFFILPSLAGVILSFMNVFAFKLSDITFAGLNNYKNIFMDEYLSAAIKNSFIFSTVTTVLKVSLGMLLAIFLNQKLKTKNYLRTVYFLPAVLNSIAVGLIFTAAMHPTTGIINIFFRAVGLGFLEQNWLTNPKIAIFSVAFIEIWKWTGFTMIIILAGLQSISKEYYEASEIDGASTLKKFAYITFPLVMPYFNNALVVNIIGGLKVFDLVQAVTQGGPGSATEVFGTLVYKAFGSGRFGEGCAASILLTIIVLAIALPTNKYLSSKEVEL